MDLNRTTRKKQKISHMLTNLVRCLISTTAACDVKLVKKI